LLHFAGRVFGRVCIFSPNTPDEELPLKPVTGSDRSTNGRQQASIELTNRGRQLLEAGRLENPPRFSEVDLASFQSLSLLLSCQGALHAAGIPEGASLLGQAERFLEAIRSGYRACMFCAE
jgi:hypothetical protein